MTGMPLDAGTLLGLIAIIAAGMFALIVARPHFGAYLFLFANPLIVGIERGKMIPFLRPNEALLFLVAIALAVRMLLLILSGRRYRFALGACDGSFLLLAGTSSILPLMLRYGRGLPITLDDVLYAIVLWKYYIVYRVFRAAVTTPAQVLNCLIVSMVSATIVAAVAILQVNDLLGVPEFLQAHYDSTAEAPSAVFTERGTSTIGSSFGTADLMIMNLVIAIGLMAGFARNRLPLMVAGCIFLSGCIVAGQFSGYIGLALALMMSLVLFGSPGRLVGFALPGLIVAGAAFWPVIARRLTGFSEADGIPQSWTVRWENLQTFFFPELFSGLNWLFGVRPAPRVVAPEAWRAFVYIESGYVWLLWIGGIPLVAAFVYFVWIWARHLWHATRTCKGAVNVAAGAALAYLAVIVALMLFDPHLTLRGSADLFFPLLGLTFLRPVAQEDSLEMVPRTRDSPKLALQPAHPLLR